MAAWNVPDVSIETMFATAVRLGGNLSAVAEELGFTNRGTVWHRLKTAGMLAQLRERT